MAAQKTAKLPQPKLDPDTYEQHRKALDVAEHLPPEQYTVVVLKLLEAVEEAGFIQVLAALESVYHKTNQPSQQQQQPTRRRPQQQQADQAPESGVSIDEITKGAPAKGTPAQMETVRPFG